MYPKLRESLEYILTEHVEKRQRKVKNKIKERIEMENAYMNTDHEDFLGLKGAMRLMEDNNVPKNESVETPKTRSLTKTKSQSTFHLNSNIVQEGWITIRNSKMFWFVLTDFNLSWYKKEDKKSRIAGYDVNPSTVMQYDLTGTQITLTFSNKKSDEMELLFQSRDDFNRWYDAFSIVGIVVDDPERKSLLTFEEQNGKPNVLLTHQTELIRVLVDSYIKIIKKNLKDIIPKLLMHGVINNTREFLTSELHVSILAQDKDELLQFDPEAERLHKELTEKFDSCKEALTMIRKIATDSF
ncbi:dynamin-1-like isoform X14 [Leptotrombidium deliense]|uniref:dynamin GTPase n=1 Tax=Leptotrombidium deliense TaxID=299467 RepID=A0A443S4A0_9ACAR|nr:dynamin-1-like isoform X14 [Leptotrombidium deliense]